MTDTRTALARLVPGSRTTFRFFSSASDASRARRPTDGVLLGACIAVLAAATIVNTTSSLAQSVTAVIQALPGLIGWFWELCDTLIIIWAFTVVVVTVCSGHRLTLLRDQILAIAIALLAGGLLLEEGNSVATGLTATGPKPIYPAIRIAVSVAILATSSPHLGRPARRIGRWLIVTASLSAVALGIATPIGVIAGMAIGGGAAAIVHLLLGSPGGSPTVASVTQALLEMGVAATDVVAGGLERRGVALLQAADPDGIPLIVKVYGRDARDGQLVNVVWSYLWYRDETPFLTLSRLRLVEHEAFLTLLAERAGAAVLPVRAAGMADDDAVIVLEDSGEWIADRPDDALADAFLEQAWTALGHLHRAGLAHGALDEQHLAILPDGNAALGGFSGANTAAAPAQISNDRAQLLGTTAIRVGTERAIAAAHSALGADGLAGLLPFLQTAALTRPTRGRLKGSPTLLSELRDHAATAAETDVPKLEPLRRVTLGSVLMVAVLVFAVWAVITALSHVGLAALLDEMQKADSVWVWTALIFSQSIWITEAFSTLGACPRPLRLGPVIGLQFAIRFISLAVPSSAGRVALNVRFFQRAGLATSPAIAVGLVDSLAGFVVQTFLLITLWLAGLGTLSFSFNGISLDISSETVLAIVIVIVIGLAIAILTPKVRRAIRPRLSEAAEALQVLRVPTKVLQLFGGNLIAQVLMAITLGICLRAFGAQTSLANLILINTLASLFSGVMPVPGGIGVMEAALSAGLIAAGIPQPTAVATAMLYRLVTFYLPPIWGAYALRVLRRREYL
ncbi:MAG: lysylphosphatidylglycerol synthase transmembrane domain-containing protein [Actinomycetota bacterium]